MNRYTKVRELVKDPSLTIKDIAQQTGYDKGHVSRLRKASQQFECPRCGHCCQPQNDTPLRVIQERMQEEIDELRQALEANGGNCYGDGTIYRGQRSKDSAVKTYNFRAKLKEKNHG